MSDFEPKIVKKIKCETAADWFRFFDPNSFGNDYDKSVKNGILSYSQEDFSGPEIPMTLSLPHEIISPNPLPNSRFYEKDGKILLVNSKVCQLIFQKINSNWNTDSGNIKLYISGPQGVGKTFGLTYLNFLFKNLKGFQGKMRVVHVIWSESYFEQFYDYFLKELVFSFALDENDPNLQGPNQIYDPSCSKLKKWWNYLQNDLDYKKLSEFLEKLTLFCKQTQKCFAVIFDEENIYKKCEQRKMKHDKKDFFRVLFQEKLINVFIHCYSDNNDLSQINQKIPAHQILHLKQYFNEEEAKSLLQFYLDKKYWENDKDFKDIKKKTFLNPLELMHFIRSDGNDEKTKIQSYWNERLKEIFEDHLIFEKNQLNSDEKKENFLKSWIKIYNCEDQKDFFELERSYELYLNKKFFFIDEKGILRIICPVARKLLENYHIKELEKFKNIHNDFIFSIPNVLAKTMKLNKNDISGSGRGALFETYINAMFQLNTKQNTKILYWQFSKNDGVKSNEINFKYNYSYYFTTSEYMTTFPNFSSNRFVIPTISNFENIDALLWDQETQIFYCFQITINLQKHEKVDQAFGSSKIAKDLKNIKKNCKIQFIWIAGPSNIVDLELKNYYINDGKNVIHEDSWVIFPKENQNLFKNLEEY